MTATPTPNQLRADADHRGMAIALRAVLRRGDHAVDVGAHTGDVTRQILGSTGATGRILAVEPLPHLAARLRDELPSAVIVEQCAVIDEDAQDETDFVHVTDNAGYSGLRERDYPGEQQLEQIRVRTARLDDLVERHGVRPSLIKIDVEGAELRVLRSAQRTIRTHRPVILVEHGTAAAAYGDTHEEFWEFATSLGLRVYNLDGDAAYEREAFLETVGADDHFNFLLRD